MEAARAAVTHSTVHNGTYNDQIRIFSGNGPGGCEKSPVYQDPSLFMLPESNVSLEKFTPPRCLVRETVQDYTYLDTKNCNDNGYWHVNNVEYGLTLDDEAGPPSSASLDCASGVLVQESLVPPEGSHRVYPLIHNEETTQGGDEHIIDSRNPSLVYAPEYCWYTAERSDLDAVQWTGGMPPRAGNSPNDWPCDCLHIKTGEFTESHSCEGSPAEGAQYTPPKAFEDSVLCPFCLNIGAHSIWLPYRSVEECAVIYSCDEGNHSMAVPFCPLCESLDMRVVFDQKARKYFLYGECGHFASIPEFICSRCRDVDAKHGVPFKIDWRKGTLCLRCTGDPKREHDWWYVRCQNSWIRRRTWQRYQKMVTHAERIRQDARAFLLGLPRIGEVEPDHGYWKTAIRHLLREEEKKRRRSKMSRGVRPHVDSNDDLQTMPVPEDVVLVQYSQMPDCRWNGPPRSFVPNPSLESCASHIDVAVPISNQDISASVAARQVFTTSNSALWSSNSGAILRPLKRVRHDDFRERRHQSEWSETFPCGVDPQNRLLSSLGLRLSR